MGRLTRRNEKGEAYVQLYSDPNRAADVIAERAKKEKEVIERLARYEDLEEKGGWIPITDRLPEDGEHVLISFENFGEATIALYKEDDEGGAFYGSTTGPKFVSYGLFVNAWMPLPAPYREEQEDA